MRVAPGAAPTWPDQIFQRLREAGISQMVYVPDAGHARLIELCHQANDINCTVLTTEEEGIGILAGAWLGGERGVLLMQSSGVGNCINTLSRQGLRFPPLDHRDDARAVGRDQSLASADGTDHGR
jgi:sulfopyruvate decarboxylase TPP-binding subunit